jgi:hypothetical protein
MMSNCLARAVIIWLIAFWLTVILALGYFAFSVLAAPPPLPQNPPQASTVYLPVVLNEELLPRHSYCPAELCP